MASIESRIASLEQTSKVSALRQLTDAERAVRLLYIFKHPDVFPSHAPLREILKRSGGSAAPLSNDVRRT